MRQLIRILIGVTLGVVISFFFRGEQFQLVIAHISNVMLQVGLYVLYPVLFFGIITSIVRCEISGYSRAVHVYVFVWSLAITAIAIAVGFATVLIIRPMPLPILFQITQAIEIPQWSQLIAEIFPSNFFTIFTGRTHYFIPLLVSSCIIGLVLREEKNNIKHIANIIDELYRLFRKIVIFYAEFVGIPLLFLSIHTVFTFRALTELRLNFELVLMLIIQSIFFIVVILPLIMIRRNGSTNPFVVIKQFLVAAVAGFLGRDVFYSAPLLYNVLQKKYGVDSLVPHATLGLGLFISRAGTMLVGSSVLIVIIQSYSSIAVDFSLLVKLFFLSIVFAPLASTMPSIGLVGVIAVLMQEATQGIGDAYLLILPLLPLLVALVAFIDAITLGVVGHLTERSCSSIKKSNL